MNASYKWIIAAVLAMSLSASALAAEAPPTKKPEAPPAKKPATTPKSVVAVFRIHAPIVETPVDEAFPFGGHRQPTALKDLVRRLAKARDDQAVKAVVLLLENSSLATSQVEELRQAIAEVRKAGKDVYAHADGLDMPGFALVAGATHVSVVPTGDIWLTGLFGESMYLRGLFNKLGVTPDFLTCGKYKSAAETFMREGPSTQAEEMQNWLLDSTYVTQLRLMAQGRGVDTEKVRQWIDGGPYTARRAKELGIIDSADERQDLEATLKKRFGDQVQFDHKYGASSRPQIDFTSPFAAFEIFGEILGSKHKKVHKTSVAIVYVDGPIMLGESENDSIFGGSAVASSTALRRALDDAAADDTVKAVVLRVSSPGGSATASDVILDATRRVKARKPLVVSMGPVAASGGYYVTCAAETIFADEATITGSIGVVGGKLATTDMWNKIGIKFKSYERGKQAGLLSSATVFNPGQRVHMQAWMDEIYGVFKNHVTTARGKKLKKPIDELAGGRVYTGRQALELGLVDKIGTLDDAVKFAAREAKLDKYELRVVPEPKNFLEQLLEPDSDDKTSEKRLVSLFGSSDSSWLRAALPVFEKLDPARLDALRLALVRLDLLQREGVVLMAPEMIIGR
jgi:protease IV